MTKPLFILALICFLFIKSTLSQNVAINNNNAAPAASAILDLQSSNKGFLVPRIALTSANSAAPITAPTTSLLVYNTATAGVFPNDVSPGYYYWEGRWQRLITNNNEAWSLTGNEGTSDAKNFIGTTDAMPLIFKTNGNYVGRLYTEDDNTLLGRDAGLQIFGGSANQFSTMIGAGSGMMSTGNNNTIIGANAGNIVSTGFSNTFLGKDAGILITTGNGNTLVGEAAKAGNTDINITSVGRSAGGSGASNVFLGYRTGFTLSGNQNLIAGFEAGQTITSASSNTFLGYRTGENRAASTGNIFIGDQAGSMSAAYAADASANIYVGRNSGKNNIGLYNVALGDSAGYYSSNTNSNSITLLGSHTNTSGAVTNATAIGANARVDASNSIVLGSVAGINGAAVDTKVAIGSNTPSTSLDIKGDIALRQKSVVIGNGNTLSLNASNASFLYVSGPTADFFIGGVSNGYDGKIVTIYNRTLFDMVIGHEYAASTAAERISTGMGSLFIRDSGSVTLQYNIATSRWIVTGYSNALAQDGSTDYYSVTGTTLVAAPNAAYGTMSQMSSSFTPASNIAYVNFSAAGSAINTCGQTGIYFMLNVNGVNTIPFHTSLEDMNDNTGKFWDINFNYPINVVAGATNTVSILWQSGCPVVNAVTNGPGGGNSPAGSFRTLMIAAPRGTGNISASGVGAVSYWSTSGNNAIVPNVDFLGTTNNVDLTIKTNNTTAITIDGSTQNVGIGSVTPNTSLLVNGGFGLSPTSMSIAANVTITPGNRSYYRITSSVVPALAIVSLGAGVEVGQILIIECTGASAAGMGFEFVQGTSTNVQVSAIAGTIVSMNSNDVTTFLWTGSTWIRISTTAN